MLKTGLKLSQKTLNVRSFSTTKSALDVTEFHMPPISLFGPGSVEHAMDLIKKKGFKKALIVTDPGIVKTGLSDQVATLLKERGIYTTLYGEVQPNPSTKNVDAGLALLKANSCDAIVSIGGGSSHDCAKIIGLIATNGGIPQDYEGVEKSENLQVPQIAINTTAGTAAEVTKNAVITDLERHVKMLIVDSNTTPLIAVNDPVTHAGMPKSLTAATGMDALTHAIEAYVSTGVNPISDCLALKAIEMVTDNLPAAVEDGSNLTARQNMAYAEFIAGMSFNSAGLGYVHAMAHQLGGIYGLPHGVCNAVLLPHVEKFNSRAVSERLGEVAKHMGCSEHTAEAAITKIKELSKTVGIPAGLEELGVKIEDFGLLADNAMKDACAGTNPVQPTKEEIIDIFKEAF